MWIFCGFVDCEKTGLLTAGGIDGNAGLLLKGGGAGFAGIKMGLAKPVLNLFY